MKRIAIVGCRPPKWNPSRKRAEHEAEVALFHRILEDVERFMTDIDAPDLVLVSGGANGVDSHAEAIAVHALVWDTSIHRPDYERFGFKRAPLIRNTLIVADADEVHAWPAPWSRGTWDTINKARAAGKPVTVHEVKP